MNIARGPAWQFAETVFATVDRMNASAFAEYFTADGLFVFANWPEACGSNAIQTIVDDFFKSIAALRHEVLNVWRVDDVDICQLRVIYTRHDGSQVSLPCANIWRRVGDKFSEYRIYIDLNPLFATA